jgi:uncharacterized protein YbaA (DUF1428 family)
MDPAMARSTFTLLSCLVLAAVVSGLPSAARAAEADQRVYEMRVYYAAEGKLEALNARFRNHTVKLFEKHGITNIGYWEPLENPERMLVYFLAYPSREAREKSWKAFMADPEWLAAWKASEVDGKLVAKVESKYFQATDYSPAIKASQADGRIFEMRTYTAAPGRLDALHARFRDHTVKLFEKHGMTNIAYWSLMDDQPGADVTLLYILAHKDRAAADASFTAFRNDPAWTAARTASEEAAGGSLTAPGGVQSLFMRATDYSPIR